MKKKYPLAKHLLYALEDTWYVFVQELRNIFHDKGVIIIFFGAGIIYPILYPLIYDKEIIEDMPIAVVDLCNSQHTRQYIRKLDATREVQVAYKCVSMQEAKQLFEQRKVHGIVLLPEDFDYQIETIRGQAYVSIYCDMSSFLFYKNLQVASNFVMLDEMHGTIEHRYELLGYTKDMAAFLTQPIQYEDSFLYNIGGGFASFLLPALLIMILQQTMFFGIGMLAGTAREKNGELFYIEGRQNDRSVLRIIIGRAFAYFIIYYALAAYTLLLIPRLFGLPHIGNPADIMRLMVPFLLATAFFSMTISIFVRERETGLITMVFFTVLLIFMAGFSWPQSNIPTFWKELAKLFPSTFGINAYIHINTCSATLRETAHEYIALWIQTGAYFLTAVASYWGSGKIYEKTAKLHTNILKTTRLGLLAQKNE